MQRYIMHVDMDAFFASVEQLDNPQLRGRPVIVGNNIRGVVCAASYEARKFGVHSAMPTIKARKLCPCGIFVSPRHWRYSEISLQLMDIFSSFSPLVEQASIDEAYLDATGLHNLFGSVEDLGKLLKKKVLSETGLTCSVGIAPVKFLAKIASDFNKPDGFTIIYPDKMDMFLRSLPVERIPGIGPRTKEILFLLGVKTVEDIRNLPAGIMEKKLGKSGFFIRQRAYGLDNSLVVPHTRSKSEGREHTFDSDISDTVLLKKYLLGQSEKVTAAVRKVKAAGYTVTLKLKFSDFRQITRSYTLEQPTDSTKVVFAVACDLLDKIEISLPVRLVGVSLSGLVWEDEYQITSSDNLLLPGLEDIFLGRKNFDSVVKDTGREKKLEKIIDKIRECYGDDMLQRALLLEDKNSMGK